ncbi:ABC transporter substrate-binding protein [Aureisphaera galaxeae]|uniref:ABC transporter substrate-binding protein n=1 Tax=Aureisphaera galaxeae TaxID=1538023 RepID=UPI00235056CF|nr:ABC transporter substrate-binding protein [Aureisphaera galaxeae]MDC8004522.1 ABC transporter substrate-binding protein [Aureisphaera galaxeae]
MDIKIGILLPRSDMFPTLALDFLNALKLSFNKINTTEVVPKFLVEGVGTASDDSIVRLGEKMILQENADLVVSFCSHYKLADLAGVFKAYQKPLIHVNIGGNAIKQEHVHPNVVYHSLNLWQSCYAAGMHAAKKYGTKAAMAASYYDGGYQHSQAFIQGYTSQGGKIVNYYVSPMDYKSESFETMVAGIRESNPDVVFTLFSFKEGAKVMNILGSSDLSDKVPFVAIPLQTDETANTEDYGIKNLISIASWSFDEDSEYMNAFISEIKESLKKAPNIMALLGYEVGQVIAEVINTHGTIPTALADGLKNVQIPTPRGVMHYNAYNESQTDLLKVRQFTFNDVGYHNTVVDTIEASFMEDLYAKLEDIPYSGWQNPYICT